MINYKFFLFHHILKTLVFKVRKTSFSLLKFFISIRKSLIFFILKKYLIMITFFICSTMIKNLILML
jgi:hypothetical protein